MILHSCPAGNTHTHAHTHTLENISALSSWCHFSPFSLLRPGVSRADAWSTSNSEFGTAIASASPKPQRAISNVHERFEGGDFVLAGLALDHISSLHPLWFPTRSGAATAVAQPCFLCSG